MNNDDSTVKSSSKYTVSSCIRLLLTIALSVIAHLHLSKKYIYSNGIIEETNPDEETFEIDRLHQTLINSVSASLEQSIGGLIETISNWHNDRNLSDDLSIIGVGVKT